MTRTHPPPQIPVPDGFHAFLLASVSVRDPGRGSLVELALPDGTAIRSRASPDLLRRGARLDGSWRATLHFRAAGDGSLVQPVALQRLRPLTGSFEDVPVFWSAAGELERVDTDARLATLRVFPERAKRAPFAVTAALSPSLGPLGRMLDATHLRLSGHLEGLRLVATRAEAVELTRPARWSGWTPRSRADPAAR